MGCVGKVGQFDEKADVDTDLKDIKMPPHFMERIYKLHFTIEAMCNVDTVLYRPWF